MRSVGALCCGIFAVLLFTVAVPTWWVATHASSSEDFVELMAPVSVDDELHESLADETSGVLTDELDASATKPITTAITRVIRSVSSSEEFTTVWEHTLRASHGATLSDESKNRFIIDLTPLADMVVDRIDSPYGSKLTSPDSAEVPLTADSHAGSLYMVRHAQSLRWLTSIGAIALAALAIWLARSRAGAVLLLGIGCLAAIALLKLLADQAVPDALSHGATDTGLARHMIGTMSRQVAMSFHDTLKYVGLAAVVAVVSGGIGRLARPG